MVEVGSKKGRHGAQNEHCHLSVDRLGLPWLAKFLAARNLRLR